MFLINSSLLIVDNYSDDGTYEILKSLPKNIILSFVGGNAKGVKEGKLQ